MAERSTIVLKAGLTRELGTISLFKAMIDKKLADDDPLITFYLKEASQSFEKSCRRTFARQTVLDQFRLEPDCEAPRVTDLKLSQYPVTAVYALSDHSPLSGFQTTLAAPMDASQTTLPCTQSLLGYEFKAGLFPFNVMVGIDTDCEVMTVNSVNSGTTYNVTRGVNNQSVAHPLASQVNIAVDPVLYDLDSDRGMITRLGRYGSQRPWSNELVYVAYQGGYLLPNDTGANLPSDIEGAVYKAMRYLWQTKGRDPSIRSTSEPGIGQVTFWMGDQPDVVSVIEQYREVRL